jgi:hypothetical protein
VTETVDAAANDRTTSAERTHEVYFTTSAGRFYIHNPNRGVTLTADQITWTFRHKADGAPFKNIVAVQLQSGGSWHAPINLCHITFADRYKLIVSNGNEFGLANDSQRTCYRDFVHDLHARLAAHAPARAGAPIAFTAGYPAGRYPLLVLLAIVMVLITIGVPLVGLLITGEMRPFMLLIVGAFFIWPLKTMMENNAPRNYDPTKLPKELVG